MFTKTEIEKQVYYSPAEERFNVISHAFGAVLSLIGIFLLIRKAILFERFSSMMSFIIFGMSLIILYTASTLYHNTKEPNLRYRMRIVDHACIYILIAGSYTPYTIITLKNDIGWNLFVAIWGMAFIGIIWKIFFTGRFDTLSIIFYCIMGWVGIVAIKPLMESLDYYGLIWLMIGGISYSVGAVFFAFERIHFNHAIFHVFVLIGSFCHFVSIHSYVIE